MQHYNLFTILLILTTTTFAQPTYSKSSSQLLLEGTSIPRLAQTDKCEKWIDLTERPLVLMLISMFVLPLFVFIRRDYH